MRIDPFAVASILCAIAPVLVFRLSYGRDIPQAIGVPAILGPFFAIGFGRMARARAHRLVGASSKPATLGLVLGYLGLAVLLAIGVWLLFVVLMISGWGNL